jgi:hypothetical protein
MWRVFVQTKLSFMDCLPVPKTSVWDQLNDEQKNVAAETIARLMARIILAKNNQEQKNDR